MQFKTNAEAYDGIKKITMFFRPSEFECPCCGMYLMDDLTVVRLDILRRRCGFPIIIESAYRCAKHNQDEKIKGATHSMHLLGQAVDIKSRLMTSSELHMIVMMGLNLFDGFGMGLNRLHFDTRDNPTAWGY